MARTADKQTNKQSAAMPRKEEIRVCLAGPDAASSEGLIAAIREEGWTVDVVDEIEDCLEAASAGDCQIVVIACSRPRQLQREPIRKLMALRADMSLLFLVGDDWPQHELPALAGATSDEILSMSSPIEELMETLRGELQSVLQDHPKYVIVCVDDDREFLASLETFLPKHLRSSSRRFDLDFEFFHDPSDALEMCEQFDSGELAVVISDQRMPDMKGIELLARVKKLHPQSKRVLLTGHAGLDSAVTAINERVLNKYVFKPVEPVGFSEGLRLLLSEFHLQFRAETRRNRMMAQFEFVRAISAAKSIAEVLANTVSFLDEQIRPAEVRIALMQDGQLALCAMHPAAEGLSIGDTVSTDESLWGWLVRHARPIRVAKQADLPDGIAAASELPILAAPLLRDKSVFGAIVLSGRPARTGAFSREEALLMSFVADAASVAVGSFKDRQAVERNYVSTMACLMETVEAKDSYTRGHTERVKEFALDLAREIGVTGQCLQDIEWAAALHDIGKIALPDAILLKSDSLTDEEYTAVKDHPIRADKILQHLRHLNAARMMIRGHHESYDGRGYPDGLTGEEIPLGARILTIADSYDAMTSTRPYRDAMDPMDALGEIAANVGRQFDPRLAEAFLTMMRRRLCSPAPPTDATRLAHQRSER